MTRFISLVSAAAAVLALAACNDPRPEETETASAFPGADAVADRSAPPAETAPPGTGPEDEGAPLNPPPTLPPEDDPTSPAAGVTSPPER